MREININLSESEVGLILVSLTSLEENFKHEDQANMDRLKQRINDLTEKIDEAIPEEWS